MKMEMETYRSQQKLFFIASCALFPKRVVDSPITAIDLLGYDEQLKDLEEYQSVEMLELIVDHDNNGNKQYSISNIDQDKFYKMLINYLEKFRNDELLAKPSEKPEPYITLQNKLYQYLRLSSRKKPTVNPYNIWIDWYKGYGKIRPFWEIVLSSSELSPKTTRIINLGYREVETSGFGDSPPASFAEVEIINAKVLMNAVAINPNSNQLPKNNAGTSRVTVDGRARDGSFASL